MSANKVIQHVETCNQRGTQRVSPTKKDSAKVGISSSPFQTHKYLGIGRLHLLNLNSKIVQIPVNLTPLPMQDC